jgi:hypothetical protein
MYVNNYLELASHIDSIIATTDFSKINFKNKSEIDLSKFDLSKLPVADFGKVNNTVDLIYSKINEYGAMINCSRMCEQNKKNGIDRINLIKTDINLYKKDNDVSDASEKLQKAWYISSRLFDLISFVPTKLKEEVKHLDHRLEADIKEINPIVESRQFLINKLSDGLVEKSKDFRVQLLKEEIKKNGLTVKDIKNITDDDCLRAARWYAGEEFSRGAADIVSAVFYAGKFNNEFPEVSWMFSDQVEGAINFAKKIGLKEFAFAGDSTAALSNLNIITKMGLNFRIEEITRNNGYGDTETKPVAIVSVF